MLWWGDAILLRGHDEKQQQQKQKQKQKQTTQYYILPDDSLFLLT
jgi:hypothetical protein